MTAVVTGAAGFIGRTLVRTLLTAGQTVVGIDREPQEPQPGLTVLTGDLLGDNPAIRAALATADAVFHLAGCPGVRDEAADTSMRRYRDNVLASAMVLAGVPSRTPLVVTSSSAVYGGMRGSRPNAEADPLHPRGGYATSKLLVERLCAGRIDAGGIVTVARPFTVAGEGQRPDMALARWIEAARAGRPLRVLGSAQRIRDITDVRHAARALVALAEREIRGVVNVGTGVGYTLAAMIETVATALGVDVRSRADPAPAIEAENTLADTGRLRRLIGWVPETDLLDVVRRQIAAGSPARVSPSSAVAVS